MPATTSCELALALRSLRARTDTTRTRQGRSGGHTDTRAAKSTQEVTIQRAPRAAEASHPTFSLRAKLFRMAARGGRRIM